MSAEGSVTLVSVSWQGVSKLIPLPSRCVLRFFLKYLLCALINSLSYFLLLLGGCLFCLFVPLFISIFYLRFGFFAWSPVFCVTRTIRFVFLIGLDDRISLGCLQKFKILLRMLPIIQDVPEKVFQEVPLPF